MAYDSTPRALVRRDLAAALLATVANLMVVGSLFVIPDPHVPAIGFWLPALAATASGFAGVFSLWLDSGQRRISAFFLALAGAILAVAAPLVPSPSAARLLVTFAVPAGLLLLGAYVLVPRWRRATIRR